MSDDRLSFIRAICENPADDTSRLVFADWLEERGELSQAHYIRDSINRPDVVQLFNVEPPWSVMPDGITPQWARGFVTAVTCTAQRWLSVADDISWHPEQTVECRAKGCEYGTIGRPRPGDVGGQWMGRMCDACDGMGRVARPLPATAQPITRVTMTDVYTPVIGSRFVVVDGSPQTLESFAERWKGITFTPPTT